MKGWSKGPRGLGETASMRLLPHRAQSIAVPAPLPPTCRAQRQPLASRLGEALTATLSPQILGPGYKSTRLEMGEAEVL